MVISQSPSTIRAPYGFPGGRGGSSAPTSADSSSESNSPRQQHLADLRRVAKSQSIRASFGYLAKRSVPISFLFFTGQALKTIWLTALLSPATIVSDPLGTLAGLLFYPIIWIGLGTAVFVFWILSMLQGQKVIDYLSDKYAEGWSMVNWPNPQIFDRSSRQAVGEAREWLTGEKPTTVVEEVAITEENPDFTTTKTTRIFSLPLARAFLLMSALVYERSDKNVRQASDIAFNATQKYKPGTDSYKREMKRAEGAILESEKKIKDKVAEWGLEFDGVSDLATIGGPFASIFFTPYESEKKPFIVLCFKGTTPSEFSEFLVDAAIARTSAQVYFGPGSGTAHRGFYTDLFTTNDASSAKGGSATISSDGYASSSFSSPSHHLLKLVHEQGSIVKTLKHVADRMKEEWPGKDLKIPLWVTGHSLGSALASLTYARFLHSPEDLGETLELKDSYVYGTPRLGDGSFAAAFEADLINPIGRTNILWRVANNADVVSLVPPGVADAETSRAAVPSQSVINYAFLGPAIRLRPVNWFRSLPYYNVENIGALHSATEVRVEDHVPRMDHPTGTDKDALAGYKKRSARYKSVHEAQGHNPLRNIMALFLPFFVYDHFPASYLQHLNNLETSDEQAARERRDGTSSGLFSKPLGFLRGLTGEASRRKELIMEDVQKLGRK
ncbi:hypothetical protein JCM8547_004037 [Rhodosporidiobolus lusitaniae]